ncbi:uncharacterized protein [Prorops nasuta]|uniref:uncharacterized protein n=1 Tax=Prorops nasuta TaxID=863751 RepID=UPI0034CD1D29
MFSITQISWTHAYNITHLKHNPGIFFEKIATLQYYPVLWEVATTIDIANLTSQAPNLGKFYETIFYVCKVDTEHFASILRRGLRPTNRSRNRRSAPLGFIGGLSKTLFGTLTEEDGEYYTGEILKLQEKGAHTAHLLEKQTHVVQSEFSALHHALNRLNNNTQELQGQTRALADAIALSNDALEQEKHARALQEATHRTGFSLPFDEKELLMEDIQELSHLHINHYKGQLVVVIEIPLLNKEEYHLYKTYPYPTHHTRPDNQTITTFIQPAHPYLAVSSSQRFYSNIPSASLSHCLHHLKTYYCAPGAPLHKIAYNQEWLPLSPAPSGPLRFNPEPGYTLSQNRNKSPSSAKETYGELKPSLEMELSN